jgi:hypothetical protein
MGTGRTGILVLHLKLLKLPPGLLHLPLGPLYLQLVGLHLLLLRHLLDLVLLEHRLQFYLL